MLARALVALTLAACGSVRTADAGPDVSRADATADRADTRSAADAPDDPPVDAMSDTRIDAASDAAPAVVTATNPVIAGDHPDPDVLRVIGADGRATYYLVHTAGSGVDIPIYTSRDLVAWTRLADGAFRRSATPGDSLAIGDHHYCNVWAPEIRPVPGGYVLSFTATRFASPRHPCPAYDEDSGVYLAYSASPTGPFAPLDHPWEPLPTGGQISTCAAAVRDAIPHSPDVAFHGCAGGFCDNVVRLDDDVFHDPLTDRWWLAYAWYTNSPALASWEFTNMGEHVSLVELDASDPFAVICQTRVPKVFAASPHDAPTLAALGAYCPRCGEMLSNTRGRFDEEMSRGGHSWGVNEAPMLFRRNGLVYLLASGSAWDSAYYHVFWLAAPSVEQLAYDSPSRIVGRFIVPSLGQSFGHGTAVLGPDGVHWYYVHHRLDQGPCRASGACGRDIWISPMTFDDRADGRGPAWLRAIFPAEARGVSVTLP
ncbi:MAG: family 43 glycosylhydrolase [Deltaproteobacteria bacterium]